MAKQPRFDYTATATLNNGEIITLKLNTTTPWMAYRMAERRLAKQGITQQDYTGPANEKGMRPINLSIKPALEVEEQEALAEPEQPAAGTRVQGKAAVGNKVTYFDMANQDGKVWEVISLPEDNVDPKWGWTSGYQLRGEDGTESWSDLRQHGWTFA